MYQPYMVAMSHLSDSQELMSHGMIEEASRHINFAKWLIIRYTSKMTEEFDPNKEWAGFVEQGF